MNHIRTLIVSVRILVITISILFVQNAAAYFLLTDSFEDNPAGRWVIKSSPYIPFSTRGESYANHGEFAISSAARTGSNYIYMTAGNDPAWWSAVRTKINIPENTTTCFLRFYVKPWYRTRNDIRLEVIDPATWTYISYKDITIEDDNHEAYKFVQSDAWSAFPKTVYVRILLWGGTYIPGFEFYSPTIGVDDMTVFCPF